MGTWVRHVPGLLCTAAAIVAAGACSSPPADAGGQPPPAPASASPASSAAASPNAPEVNPAGDIPDNQVFVVYRPPGAGFAVSVPEGWARTADGAATTFTDKFNSVRLETVPRAAAPTLDSERSVPTPGTRTAASEVTRRAGTAILLGYTAESPPNPVTGKTVRTAVERYEFWKGGRLAVLTLTAPQGADNVDPWRIVTDSFTWTA